MMFVFHTISYICDSMMSKRHGKGIGGSVIHTWVLRGE